MTKMTIKMKFILSIISPNKIMYNNNTSCFYTKSKIIPKRMFSKKQKVR